MKGSSSPLPVTILGMHRSGTSFVARVCNLLGLYLGPQEAMLAPAADNPKGFWEHEGLMRMSVEVLKAMGRTSGEPRLPLPVHWTKDPAVSALEARARSLVEPLQRQSPWGWKDPRLCLTLPFWQGLLGPLRGVFVFREPMAVAHSLRQRGNFPLEKGLHLWAQYVYSGLSNLQRMPLRLVRFERCFHNLDLEVRRLAQFLHLWPNPEKLASISRFREERLWHHRRPSQEEKQAFPRYKRVFLAYAILTQAEPLPAAGQWAARMVPALLQPLALSPQSFD